MKKLSDERLEQMLSAYCEADPQQTFTFHPEETRKKLIPFAGFNRVATAAASLVLVSVLSLTVYFLVGYNISTPFAVAPSPQSVTTPSTPTGESDSDPNHPVPEPTQPKSLWKNIVDFLFPQPTENNSTANNRTSPTETNRKPTAAPSATEAAKPTPTQKAGEKATEKPYVQPTEHQPIRPTEKSPDPTVPIDPPSDDPTEGSSHSGAPVPTDPPGEGDEPWLIPPTEGSIEINVPVEVYARIDSGLMSGVTGVYCKVYGGDSLIGSSDLYDSSHSAYILDSALGQIEVLYEIPEGLINSVGKYIFVFYDQNGNELARVKEYVY
ncbi:MAG: hypothetical protein IJG99_01630 [Ruminococcus sp.]|nr:hypothetical protein [Ruminococcus sp.]